jgi:uncharacterized membrane protein YuzA (DUF378 family)
MGEINVDRWKIPLGRFRHKLVGNIMMGVKEMWTGLSYVITGFSGGLLCTV